MGWGASAAIFVVLGKAILWPLVLILRTLSRRPWLVEAFPKGQAHFEGFAWSVVGPRRSREVVDAIADGIVAGNSSPARPDAKPTRFDRPHQRRTMAL